MMGTNDLLSEFALEKICEFKGRTYSARDNGSIMRHPKDGCKATKNDNVWTFGKKDERTGYMFYCSERVHQIVATAFHGAPLDPTLVVDHKDTNKCNNRPENLHWVTRLENALNNPYTRKRIVAKCGSVEAFLKNPSILRESSADPNFSWMRTVSKEEAAKCKKNLDRWLEEDKGEEGQSSSNGIGPWIFEDRSNASKTGFGQSWDSEWVTKDYRSHYQRQMDEIEELNRKYKEEIFGLKPSLTPNAYQLNWKTPSEFPQCPQVITDQPLRDYLEKLVPGALYVHNSVYESPVLKAELKADGSLIAVLCTTDGVTNYALSEITFDGEHFIHKSIRTFFHEDGAEKYFTESLGKEWTGGPVMEDDC